METKVQGMGKEISTVQVLQNHIGIPIHILVVSIRSFEVLAPHLLDV